jgi:uncharacterized protein (DUF2141 family)
MVKIVLGVFIVLSYSAEAQNIIAKFVEMPDKKGNIYAAIYNNAKDFTDRPLKGLNIPYAGNGKIDIDFGNLPPGDYAISFFLDYNGDGKINKNFIGWPTEPFGLSKQPKVLTGPPKFEQCKFKHSDKKTEIQIKPY